MSSKNILIKVNQLYKIFGDGDKSALDLVKNGMGKAVSYTHLTLPTMRTV